MFFHGLGNEARRIGKKKVMGTRGVLGIRVGGQDKLAYNHFDSYPDGLGNETIEALHHLLNDKQALCDKANALTAVAEGSEPTPEQVERLKPFADTSVSRQSTKDWYCLLRGTQGNLKAILEVGLYEDASDFVKDSLFCEWGYVVNLDEEVLEVYQGFQKQPHGRGRFASSEPSETVGDRSYYSIALIGTIALKTISANKQAAIEELKAMTKQDEEETA